MKYLLSRRLPLNWNLLLPLTPDSDLYVYQRVKNFSFLRSFLCRVQYSECAQGEICIMRGCAKNINEMHTANRKTLNMGEFFKGTVSDS
jgi:hypothetical protein